jgi:pyruvate dehydrogenase E2 component (dihydrolipoamide acetyltransferase)
MEEGTIVEYKVSVGDEVKKGDCIFEVETDKAALDVESPAEGFVKHIIAQVGQTLLVGDTVLILGAKDEQVPQSMVDSLKAKTACDHTQAAAAQTATVPETSETQTAVLLSNAKLGDVVPLSKTQKITARKMLQSKREIPCFYLTAKADVTELVELRAQLNSTGDVKISYNDFVMRALASALQKFPLMAGCVQADTIRLADSINIGLATAVADALVAPVVKGVDKKNLARIAQDSKALIKKARGNQLEPADLEGGCITVSNLGAFGAESNTAIVVPGQCSILGIGRIAESCVPNSAGVAVRMLMNLTLSVDHRIANGAYAAQFLDFAKRLLEDTSNFAL